MWDDVALFKNKYRNFKTVKISEGMPQPLRHDVVSWRPQFNLIYGSLALGILVSSIFVLSSTYDSKATLSWLFYSSDEGESGDEISPREQSPSPICSRPDQGLKGWKIPSKEEMPPLESFELTHELMKNNAKDNTVIVTYGNYAFLDFILNWVRHLSDLGLFNILVGALDSKLLEALYWQGIPVFYNGSNMTIADLGWGSKVFHVMGWRKAIFSDSLLQFGFEILLSDTDVVWLKNPLPYVSRYPDADILTSTDHIYSTVVDDSLEIWQPGH